MDIWPDAIDPHFYDKSINNREHDENVVQYLFKAQIRFPKTHQF